MKSRAKNRAKKNKKPRASKSQINSTHEGLQLSLCMIVKDEAKHLGNCLKSVKPAVDEIIVVDTGSTDTTVAIAKAHGAKVFQFPWCNDFSAARNESIKHATGDYIIWLDADDIVDEQNVIRLINLKKQLPPKKDQAYFIVVESADQQAGASVFNQLRIFPNCSSARFELPIHEQISRSLENAGITLRVTDIAVRHVGNLSHEELTRKTRRNIKIIEAVLEKDPQNLLMNFHAARSWANLEEQQKAIDYMQQVWNDPEVRREKGSLYFESGLLMGRYYNGLKLFSSAESILKQLIRDFPDMDLIKFELGKCFFLGERYHEAIDLLNGSLDKELQPGFIPINADLIRFQQYYFLGKAYEQTDAQEKAIEMYKKSLTYQAGHGQSYHALAMLSLKKGSYQDALDYLSRSDENGADDAGVLQANLGLVYRKLKNFPEAEKALMRAIEINPDRLEAFINLGYLYMENQRYDEATVAFKRALKQDNELWDVHLSICEAYFRTGLVDQLVEACNTLLQKLNISINQTLEGIEDLAAIFETIGDGFLQHNKKELSVMAYQTGFVMHPLTTILHKLLPLASESKRQQAVMATIKETLSRYAQHEDIIRSIQGVLDQFKHTADYAYK